jgi:hypothetical protein
MAMNSFRVAPILLAVAAVAPAQTRIVDEATFNFVRAGSPFGTENYKIVRRLGSDGVEYLAQCTRATSGRIVKTALTADSAGSPTTYSRTVTGEGGGSMNARRTVNRLTVDETGQQSSTKDYMFAAGSLILDDDVIHQLYFVTLGSPRAIAFVAPGLRGSGQGSLIEAGRDNVTIGRVSVPATRYVFTTGDTRREIWVDSSRRLLKVSIPTLQIVGTREAPPR